jgi:ankyrin repeat protein
MHEAARLGHADVVKLLLSVGADKDRAGANGPTPLVAAVAGCESTRADSVFDIDSCEPAVFAVLRLQQPTGDSAMSILSSN